MIRSNEFNDILIGDYINVSVNNLVIPSVSENQEETTTTVSFNTKLLFAGLNTYLNIGDIALTKPHAVLVPETPLFNSPMNLTRSAVGGYYNSFMHQKVLPAVYNALQNELNNSIITYRDLLSKTINTNLKSGAINSWGGVSSSWNWYDTNLRLMGEIDVYGSIILSSSFYDVGVANRQLPLFRLNPELISANRNWYWLSPVVQSMLFGCSSKGGDSAYGYATDSGGVRPRFLIG